MSGSFPQVDEPAAVFQFGEFTFDCSSHLLLRDGVERHLSPKAQQLLRLLLMARPRALSREELYDALWPSTFVCETNLASIVNEVRRALGDAARSPHYIRTVHGFGYAFDGAVPSAVSSSMPAATLWCEGSEYPLFEGDNVVGRGPDARVVPQHRSVSRRHAVIRVLDGALSIEDLGSTNGTYVDRQRIGSPVPVTSRSRIEFGAVVASINSRKISSTAKLQLNMPASRGQLAERRSDLGHPAMKWVGNRK